MDKHAVKAVKGDETVSHSPRKFSRITWYFLARDGEISVKEIDRRRCLIFIYWRFSVQFVTQKSQFTLSESNGLEYKPHPAILGLKLKQKGAAYHWYEYLRYNTPASG